MDATQPAEVDGLFATMSTARAMRRLSAEPVPDEVLRSIAQAATWAPSGSNAQGEGFVVVTDRRPSRASLPSGGA